MSDTSVSTLRPSPTAQTIFVDGVLSIFGYLFFRELLPAVCTCRYWYDCGRKGRCLEMKITHNHSRTSTLLPSLLRSPFQIHISHLCYWKIAQLSDLPELTLPNLKCLECGFVGPSKSECDNDYTSISSMFINSSSSINLLDTTSLLTLPPSLTSLQCKIWNISRFSPTSVSVDLLQTFLDATPQLQQLTEFTFMCDSLKSHPDRPGPDHRFNLSPLLHLSKLTHCTLDLSHDIMAEQQYVFAQLPLIYFHCSHLTRPEWTIFHPTSPLMTHIQHLDWSHWKPNESDWKHLIQFPPSTLHTLRLNINQPYNGLTWSGLPRLNLTTFILRSYETYHDQLDYSPLVPHLQSLHCLSHLKLDGASFRDGQLDLILGSLDQLLSLELTVCTRRRGPSLQSLPPKTIISDLEVESIDSFVAYLSQSRRVRTLTIRNIRFEHWVFQPQSLELEQELRQKCQLVSQAIQHQFELDIYEIFLRPLKPHIRIHSNPSTTPPPPRLVGVELNPGPSAAASGATAAMPEPTASSRSPTIQTIFMDGILSIFGYLSFHDLLPALFSCHYWYDCGLKERCRRMEFSMGNRYIFNHEIQSRRLLNLIDSQFRYHITSITNMNMCHLFAISQLNDFSNLHTCDLSFYGQLADQIAKFREWNKDVNMINPSMFSSAFKLSPSIRRLKIHLPHSDRTCQTTADLCQTLINSVAGSEITVFEFSTTYENRHYDLGPIGEATQLTSLRLDLCTPLTQENQRLLASLSLNELDFCGPSSPDWTIMHPESPLILSLRSWFWFDRWGAKHQNHFLRLSLHSPPNLTHLKHYLTNNQPVIDFRAFKCLSQLSLLNGWWNGYSIDEGETYELNLDEPTYELYTTVLCQCTSITQLTLDCVIINDTQLCRILTSLKDTLWSLELIGGGGPKPIREAFGHLPPITKLTTGLPPTFVFESFLTTLTKSIRSEEVIIDLCDLDDDPTLPENDSDFQSICHNRLSHAPMSIGFRLELKVTNSSAGEQLRSVYVHSLAPTNPQPYIRSLIEPSVHTKDVPPERLVGIETNPGPVVTNTTTLTPTAQTLFIDGILSIFRCLTLSDLLPALHTCRYWYECGLKERCRHLELCLHDLDEDRPQFRKLLGLIESPLRYHITNITDMNLCHILAIKQLNSFINLHTCEFYLWGELPYLINRFREWNSECTMITLDEFHQSNFQLPPSLRTLKIRLPGSTDTCPITADLCQLLINRIAESEITEFEFKTYYNDRHYDLSPIGQTPQLTYMRLLIQTPLTNEDQLLLASLTLNELSFTGPSAPDWAIFHPESSLILSIRSWSWYDSTVEFSQNHLFHLSQQHPLPPNLTHLKHYLTNDGAQTIIDFTLFTQLTQLELCADPTYGFPVEDEELPELYVPILSRCTSITHLNLGGEIFTDNQLLRILIALKDTLIVLELHGDGDDDFKSINQALEYLPPITQFETLPIRPFDLFLTTIAKSSRAQKVSVDRIGVIHESDEVEFQFPLNESDFQVVCHQRFGELMKPCGFTLELKLIYRSTINSERFVYAHSTSPTPFRDQFTAESKDVPPERLVGVETNPGPFVTNTTSTIPTVQTLFVDGLLSIFSCLTLREVIPAYHSCHCWYECGLKEKSRQMVANLSFPTGPHDRTGVRALPDIFYSRYAYHITTVLHVSIDQLWNMRQLQLSHIKKLEIWCSSSTSTVSLNMMTLPSSFTQLESLMITVYSNCTDIDLVQHLIHSIPESSSGSSLTSFTFLDYITRHFDFSMLSRLPRLSHIKFDGTFASYQQLCPSLSLRHLTCLGGLIQPDCTIWLEAESPLSMNLDELNWYDWNPTESDWDYLIHSPPPHLHTLTIQHHDVHQSFRGLPSLPSLTSCNTKRLALCVERSNSPLSVDSLNVDKRMMYRFKFTKTRLCASQYNLRCFCHNSLPYSAIF